MSLILIAGLFLTLNLRGQGPHMDFFYHPKTELSWSSCELYYPYGGRQEICFFPVINEKRNAPFGTLGYTTRISIDKPLVFAGSGNSIVHYINDSFIKLLKDKLVLFYYDGSDTTAVNELSAIIELLVQYQAAGAALLSDKDVPSLVYTSMNTEIPAISLNKASTRQIFNAAGYTIPADKKSTGEMKELEPVVFPVRMKLEINSQFEKYTKKYADYLFMPGVFSDSTIDITITNNEQSIAFILAQFLELKPKWMKTKIHYFGNYDSKVFYTGYWGRGFSDATGVYNILFTGEENYKLAVHENTHSLLMNTLGPTSSFINEGVAMFAQDKALKRQDNHLNTLHYIQNDKLYPLDELLRVDIGKNKLESEMAYAASGSFIGFLINNYGWRYLEAFWKTKQLHTLGKSVEAIEKEWLEWLSENF